MFGTDNSIEPVRGVAAVAVTADGRTAARAFVEPVPIREAKPVDLASAARRVRGSATPEANPVQAVAEARGGFFRRRPAEAAQPDAVAQQHGLYTADKLGTRRYYADYQQKQEVMRANPLRISTKLNDKQTVAAMLDLAQSRGWSTVRLRGTEDFKREAWVQAQVRGIATEGYKPTETDQQETARRKVAMAPVKAAPVQAAAVQAAGSKTSAGAVASKDTVQVKSNVTTVTPRATAAIPLAETAAAPAPKAATTAAPVAVQASAAVANDGAAMDKGKVVPVQRSKAVWGAVEAVGKQARAADATTAKATAGERSTTAATA